MKSLILILVSYSAFAQLQSPCIDSKIGIDLSCNCVKKNTCFKSYSASEKTHLKKLDDKIGNGYVAKVLEMNRFGTQFVDAFASGKIDPSTYDYTELHKSQAQIDKLNEKLLRVVEKKYKEMGMKNYKIADRAAMLDKKMEKAIHPKVLEAVQKYGMQIDFKALGIKLDGVDLGNLQNYQLAMAETKSSNKVDVGAGEKKLDDTPQVADASGLIDNTAAADKMRSGRQFKTNSIHMDSSRNIWNIISSRYLARKDLILAQVQDQRETEELKQAVLKDLFELVEKL